MNPIRPEEAEARRVYELFWTSYFDGDEKAFASVLDDDFNLIGTSETEICHNKAEAILFFRSSTAEIQGKSEFRNRVVKTLAINDLILINEMADAYIRIGEEWNFYSKIRLSTFLHKTQTGWKILQQHASLPDPRVQEGETVAFEQIKTENLQLREAIKRRTIELENKNRELEIETSLERVRAVAMGMRKPDDMLTVCQVISDQLRILGIPEIRNVQTAIIDEDGKGKYMNYQYFTQYHEGTIEHVEIAKHPAVQDMIRHMQQSPDAYFTHSFEGDALDVWKQYRRDDNQFPDPILENSPAVHFYFYSIGQGGLGISAYTPLTDDNISVFQRLRNVFALAYQRFRDIEQAEAQAREAQIEASLERVRTRSMAMQKSEELVEASNVLFIELHKLGIEAIRTGVGTIDSQKESIIVWSSQLVEQNEIKILGEVPRHAHAFFEGYFAAWQNKEPWFTYTMSGKEIAEYYKRLSSILSYPEKTEFNPQESFNVFFFPEGSLNVITPNPLSEDDCILILRFAKVFGQIYRRFLDLKLAEAQAREAKIEASLERVRSRTMGMQQSHELGDVATVLFKELNQLVENLWTCGFVLCEKDRGEDEWWLSTGDGFIPAFYLPNTVDPTHANIYAAWKNGGTYHTEQLEGEVLLDHYDWLMHIPVSKNIFDEMKAAGHSLPVWQKLHCAYFSYGYLVMITQVPCTEEQIFIRFAQVFDQTYTRFLDLQKAETQAQEARIETSLERVRAAAMIMRKPEELSTVGEVIFTELKSLGFADLRNTEIIINQENKKSIISYYYSDYGITGVIEVYYLENPTVRSWMEDMKKASDAFTKIEIHENEIGAWRIYREQIGYLPDPLLNEVKNVFYYSYSIGLGALSISSFQPITNDQMLTLERFRNVFGLAYRRYVDVALAEVQAREAQIELALERVRARTMAMQHSEELSETAHILFQQFTELGESPLQITIGIVHEEEGFIEFRVTDWAGGGLQVNRGFNASIDEPTLIHKMFTAWKAQQKSLVVDLSGKELEDWIHYRNAISGIKVSSTDTAGRRVITCAFFSKGHISFSSPEPRPKETIQLLERFAGVFDQTYTRFLDLQKAEAQGREAQIEAALERVRSKAMAMHSSLDLASTIDAFFLELKVLGVTPHRCGVGINDAETRSTQMIATTATHDGVSKKVAGTLKFAGHPVLDNIFEHWLEQKEYHPVLRGKEILDYYKVMNPQVEVTTFAEDETQYGYYFFFKEGGVFAWFDIEIDESILQIFRRFTSVLSLTHKRYMDLIQAEANAREARIEAALERVRSNAMAMHSSKDLAGTIGVFYRELKMLSETPIRCGVALLDKETRNTEVTTMNTTKQGDSIEVVGKLRMAGHKVLEDIFQHWLTQKEYHAVLRGNEIKEYYQVMRPQISFPEYPNDEIQFGYYFMFSEGHIYAWTEKELGEEDLQIYRRFTNVISLTYKRYKDLIQAEDNAREAQIEAGLERVRSRTLAMHKSDELAETAAVVFKQLITLGISPNRLYIAIIHDESGELEFWITDEDGTKVSTQFMGHKDRNDSVRKMYDGWAGQKKSITISMEGKELQEYFHYLSDELHVPFRQGLSQQKRVQTIAYFSKGFIGIASPDDQPEETTRLLERFAAVFNLTYTRFNDLQHAEAQTHKAKIEVALERVRARALAMQEPEELVEVAQVMRHEMGLLGVEELETSSIYIHDDGSDIADCWYAIKDIRVPEKKLLADHITMELPKTWVGREMLDFYTSNQQQTSIVMQGPNRIEWIKYCSSISNVLGDFYGDSIPDRTYHLYKFSNGAIGAAAEGDISEESWELLRRATSVFSLAYSRFKDLTQARVDLQKLKTEKQRAEDALAHLKSAQTQLIQSEKMASLGELTAGIAHEIQNPLNFVNNFSEVNTELIEEMKEELHLGHTGEAIAIANDIADNEQKINHHGKRADAIVKGMLQHSRSSSGQKEPTDINTLADEYLRLAYHGLRAKDKSFNATMKTDFDKTIGLVNVIPQDIGRVILNLITNAFYAVSAPKPPKGGLNSPNGEWIPTVIVSTKRWKSPSGDLGAEISVKDNGPGIPDAIKDKIFQPFFTTKPTGQGTGLGLSLSYDIVKAHGGELKVETKEGEGTEFTIQLPVT